VFLLASLSGALTASSQHRYRPRRMNRAAREIEESACFDYPPES